MNDLAQKNQDRNLTFTVYVACGSCVWFVTHISHPSLDSLDSGILEEPKHHSSKKYYFPFWSLMFDININNGGILSLINR